MKGMEIMENYDTDNTHMIYSYFFTSFVPYWLLFFLTMKGVEVIENYDTDNTFMLYSYLLCSLLVTFFNHGENGVYGEIAVFKIPT
jgi:hypothetical protein